MPRVPLGHLVSNLVGYLAGHLVGHLADLLVTCQVYLWVTLGFSEQDALQVISRVTLQVTFGVT